MIWAIPLLPALVGLGIWARGDGGRVAAPAVLALLATLALVLAAGDWTGRHAWTGTLVLQAAFVPLSQALAAAVPAVAIPVVLFAAGHEGADGRARLIGLMTVFVGGMQLILVAGDLLTLLAGWEIVGACSWALIGHRWRARPAMASAGYAFVTTRAGDLGLFLALFAVHAQTGSLAFPEPGQMHGPALGVAAFGVLVAAAAKAGQIPFAPWLFRAMDGPTSVSALLHSAAMVAAGVYLVARLQPHLAHAPGFGRAAIALGLTTAIAGGIVALREVHAKRVLAASTSAQMGLMIAATGAGYPGIATVHLILHAAVKAPLFFAAGLAHRAAGSFDLRRMRLGRALPWTAAATAGLALALGGVPPLSAAWSKEEVVKAIGHAGPAFGLAALAAGGLSAAYAARFALTAFGPGEARTAPGPGRSEAAALAGLAGAVALASVLWWPAVPDALARVPGLSLPASTPLDLAVSLVFVAAGLLTGLFLSRTPQPPPRRRWLGLAAAIDTAIVRPFEALSAAAARMDRTMIEGMPRAAATGATVVARVDRAVIDGMPRTVSAGATAAARALAGRGETWIDGVSPGEADRALARGRRGARGAVALAVQGAAATAGWAALAGETLADLVAAGPARLSGMAGRNARRLQTGLAHHYYTLLVAGVAAGLVILVLGA